MSTPTSSTIRWARSKSEFLQRAYISRSKLYQPTLCLLRYCRRIRGSHWGSDIEIQALCKVTGHSVQVYSAERIIWCVLPPSPPFPFLPHLRFPAIFSTANSPSKGSIPISMRRPSSRLNMRTWAYGQKNWKRTLLPTIHPPKFPPKLPPKLPQTRASLCLIPALPNFRAFLITLSRPGVSRQ